MTLRAPALLPALLLLAAGASASPVADEARQKISEKRYEWAAGLLKIPAEMGDADAQAVLASLYERGLGVPQDLARAADLYERSARQGRAGSQAIIGSWYLDGKAVPRDEEKARYWFAQCAAQGDSFCRLKLGGMNQLAAASQVGGVALRAAQAALHVQLEALKQAQAAQAAASVARAAASTAPVAAAAVAAPAASAAASAAPGTPWRVLPPEGSPLRPAPPARPKESAFSRLSPAQHLLIGALIGLCAAGVYFLLF